MEQGIGHLVGIVIGIFFVYWYISYQCNGRCWQRWREIRSGKNKRICKYKTYGIQTKET